MRVPGVISLVHPTSGQCIPPCQVSLKGLFCVTFLTEFATAVTMLSIHLPIPAADRSSLASRMFTQWARWRREPLRRADCCLRRGVCLLVEMRKMVGFSMVVVMSWLFCGLAATPPRYDNPPLTALFHRQHESRLLGSSRSSYSTLATRDREPKGRSRPSLGCDPECIVRCMPHCVVRCIVVNIGCGLLRWVMDLLWCRGFHPSSFPAVSSNGS